MPENIADKLLIVLVTYKQAYTNTLAYKSLFSNFQKMDKSKIANFGMFIYDNSPFETVETLDLFNVSHVYFHNPTNPGVSMAYNAGFQYAKQTGYNWLILTDQDTVFSELSLEVYLKSINTFPDILIHSPVLKTRDLIISPAKYKYKRSYLLTNIEPGIKDLRQIIPLNSGMCINRKVFEEIGVYNEKIRLDFSDFDFIRRIVNKVRYFVVMPVAFNHSLSSYDETFESALNRYKFYCNGAHHSILNITDIYLLGIIVFARGLKLSLKFKRYIFLNIFYNFYILKKEINEI